MKLQLIKKVTGLTVGKVYKKYLPKGDEIILNVCVWNDAEYPQFVPIKYFKILKD